MRAAFACALLAVAAATGWDAAPESPESFDFVVVGGGLAGCVLANRLSESGRHSVLLLSILGAPPSAYSGPVVVSDEFIIQHNASASGGMSARVYQPGYEPVKLFSTDETGSSPSRWLGGFSLVGLSLYLRDHPDALDEWGEGWGWKELRTYFHRAEGAWQADGAAEQRDYGTEGPYPVAPRPSYVNPLTREFVEAVKAVAGLPHVQDLNSETGEAVGLTPVNQHADGTKANAYEAYLRPALDRKNLVVRHGVRADRLLVRNKEVVHGVAYRNLAEGSDHVVHARKEVVITAGYVYSPKLLFLSGIGSKEELEAVGLPLIHHLPAVGKHLTAARYSPLAWHTEEPTLARLMGRPISRRGQTPDPQAYQSAVVEATARFRSSKSKRHAKRPDVVVGFLPLYYAPKSAPLQYSLQGEPWPLKTNAYTLLVTLGETVAKGSVTFPSASPDMSPDVTHEPLTKQDLELAAEAVAWARAVGGAANFSQPTAAVDNGAGGEGFWSAVYDGRGTCRMGESDTDSVVDMKLKVHGLRGVRIADGSVIPRGSPYFAAPEVLAVAERAAVLILGEHGEDLGRERHASRAGAEAQGAAETAGKAGLATSPDRPSVATLSTALGPNFRLMEAVDYLSSAGAQQLTAAGEQPLASWVPTPSGSSVLSMAGASAVLGAAAVLWRAAASAASSGAATEPLLA